MNNISHEEWEPLDARGFTDKMDAATLVMQLMNENYPVAMQRELGSWMVYTRFPYVRQARERFCDE